MIKQQTCCPVDRNPIAGGEAKRWLDLKRRGINLVRSRNKKAIFDCYLFADFSGGGEDHSAQPGIKLYKAEGDKKPVKVHPASGSKNFSRETLGQIIEAELDEASRRGRRVIFGCDHQFSWPIWLWEKAGLSRVSWREAVLGLWRGDAKRNLPQLDIPRRYCKLFNDYCQASVFWSPIKVNARRYGIESTRPNFNDEEIYRLTERVAPVQGSSSPKPANAVGGMGEGVVGGQTICGLKLIAKQLANESIAWWPFEALDISDPVFDGKHIGVEIYPSALRPAHIPQTDDNDAFHSCQYVQHADQIDGRLASLLDLSMHQNYRRQLMKEGWIVGMDQDGLFDL